MNGLRVFLLIFLPFICLFLGYPNPRNLYAGGPFQILRISPDDATAAIKTAGGKVETIKVGHVFDKHQSPIPGHELTVTEITEERIVLQDRTDLGTVILRLDGGAYKLEQIKPRQEAQPMLYAPK